ncbi:MAG TPA: GNAT family N-acetyltransferase [Actinomycetes bacterium]|nr:GNAT family N-acetyltransferase [Actinomycetes bacterium]
MTQGRSRKLRGQQRPESVAYSVASDETGEVRRFLAREWLLADRAIFGDDRDWTTHPVVVEARSGRELVGVALGEVVAGMARLNDLLVVERHRGAGVGGRLVELFCVRAAALGAARCYLRCPATERHRRFYERLGFVHVARLPRYYHNHDFLEYLREPLPAPPERHPPRPHP